MKLRALAALIVLAGLVSAQAQDNASLPAPRVVRGILSLDGKGSAPAVNLASPTLKETLAKSFCDGVGEGGRCKVPKPLDGGLYGTCCRGACRFMASDCVRDAPAYNFQDAFLRLTCSGAGEGYPCDIPQQVSKAAGKNVWGTCCGRLCRLGIDSCANYCGDGTCTEDEMNAGNCREDCAQTQPMEQVRPVQPVRPMEPVQPMQAEASGGRMPNLMVSGISWQPKAPSDDEKVNVTVTVENIGDAAVNRSFWVRLRVEENRQEVSEEEMEVTGGLKGGDAARVAFQDQLGFGRAGSFTVKADADAGSTRQHDGLVAESDEGDNGDFGTVVVQAAGGLRQYLPLAIAAAVLVAVVAAFTVFLIRSKKTITPGKPESGKSVEELLREKEEVEKMLAIAKAKYHRRELDEESFREIVRDNQKRIIEIELKIKVGGP
jgi:hypothetical protein